MATDSNDSHPRRFHTEIGDLPQFLTVGEFAAVARISRASAYRLISQGRIPAQHYGRRVVVARGVLLEGALMAPMRDESVRRRAQRRSR